jgi:putative hydrolase of the HAD superfamily
MAVRAVVFDIGGVLEITPSLGVFDSWAQRLGHSRDELTARLHDLYRAGSIGTVSEQEVLAGTARILGLDQAQLDAFMADLWTEYLGTPNVELVEYLRGLRARCRTALLSNSFVGAREREQQRYGLGELAELIVYSHEVGLSKPDPRIYRLTCDRLGVRPEEMIFLDDVPESVEGARAVGIHGIVFTSNAQAIADIEALLDREPPHSRRPS